MAELEKIYHGETTEEHRPIDIENSGPEIRGMEIPGWYDGIAYYYNINTGQRYSRAGYPIEKDEVCRYGEICKVEFYDEFGCDYKILSRRPDGDGNKSAEVS